MRLRDLCSPAQGRFFAETVSTRDEDAAMVSELVDC